MSFRETNQLHFRTPYALMRIPEYMRFFDSQGIGSFYRLLSSKIYRRGLDRLKFYKEGASVTELAKRYSAGDLCAFLSREEEADAIMVSDRSIDNFRNELVRLKLIKATPFTSAGVKGHIYQLGKVITLVDSEGYQIGEEIEGHYIDQWYTWANNDEKSETYCAFRWFLAENIGSAGKKQKTFDEIGKIFPEMAKNFSGILEKGTKGLGRVGQQKPAVKKPSIEVSTIEDENTTYSRQKGTETLFDTGEDRSDEQRDSEEVDLLIGQFQGKLRAKNMPISMLKKDYVDLVKKGADVKVVGNMLLKTVHETNRFIDLPLFSKHLEVKATSEESYLTWLWFALKFDVFGVAGPDSVKANLFVKVRTAFRQAIQKYSYEQIVWSVREIAREPKTRAAFVQNVFSIHSMISNMAGKYHTHKNSIVVSKNDVLESNQEVLTKIAQEARVKPVVKETNAEDTVEYWQNKISSTNNEMLIKFYATKIADIERRL